MVEILDISAPTKTKRPVGEDDAFQQRAWHSRAITEMQTSRVFEVNVCKPYHTLRHVCSIAWELQQSHLRLSQMYKLTPNPENFHGNSTMRKTTKQPMDMGMFHS